MPKYEYRLNNDEKWKAVIALLNNYKRANNTNIDVFYKLSSLVTILKGRKEHGRKFVLDYAHKIVHNITVNMTDNKQAIRKNQLLWLLDQIEILYTEEEMIKTPEIPEFLKPQAE